MGHWLTRLTDDSEGTRLCLEAGTVETLVDDLFRHYLTRQPGEGEKKRFVSLLKEGFNDRFCPEEERPLMPVPRRHRYVAWSNHLHSEATVIKAEMEEESRRGDAPTPRLRPVWREKAEDAIWAMMNAPEMVIIP
ncbi:MAG: hypothetical protein AAF514_12700 [Verrucomicrobiota bacterium]